MLGDWLGLLHVCFSAMKRLKRTRRSPCASRHFPSAARTYRWRTLKKTQQDAIITGEAAAYENQGVTIDEIRVSSKFDDEDLCWYIAIRNAVETVLLCIPILFLCLVLLPLTLMPKIIVTMAILVPVGGFALIGIGGDSLTRWLKAWIQWRKHRRMIFYRGEVHSA